MDVSMGAAVPASTLVQLSSPISAKELQVKLPVDPQWFRNPDKSPLSSLNRELKSGCCLDSRGSVSGFSLILFQNPDKTTASASRYGTRESRYGSRAESR